MTTASETSRRAWDWRIAYNHGLFDVDGKPTFHAYDVNHNAACEPMYGLVATTEQPNEGSYFCPACLDVTAAQPEGRAVRVYVTSEDPSA